LTVCVAVMSPGLSRPQESQPPDRPPGVSSQPPDRSPGVSSGASIPAAAPASTADRKMYEDIEILRRILDRKLHTLYPSHTCPNTGGMSGIAGMQGGIAGLQGGMGFQGGMGNFQGMGTFQGGMGWSTAGSPMGMANPIVIPIRTLEGVYLKG